MYSFEHTKLTGKKRLTRYKKEIEIQLARLWILQILLVSSAPCLPCALRTLQYSSMAKGQNLLPVAWMVSNPPIAGCPLADTAHPTSNN